MGKRENAGNQHFSFSRNVFYTLTEIVFLVALKLSSRNPLNLVESIICVLVRPSFYLQTPGNIASEVVDMVSRITKLSFANRIVVVLESINKSLICH